MRVHVLPAAMVGWLCCVLLLLGASGGHGAVIYANAGAPGPAHDGLSWATAFAGVHKAALRPSRAGRSPRTLFDQTERPFWFVEAARLLEAPEVKALYEGYPGNFGETLIELASLRILGRERAVPLAQLGSGGEARRWRGRPAGGGVPGRGGPTPSRRDRVPLP